MALVDQQALTVPRGGAATVGHLADFQDRKSDEELSNQRLHYPAIFPEFTLGVLHGPTCKTSYGAKRKIHHGSTLEDTER